MTDLTIGAFLEILDRMAPAVRAAGWDPTGLQVGDPARALRRAAVCHEVTGEVVKAVEADPVDLLVTYHPLVFHPIRALVAGPGPAGRVLRLAAAGVSVATVHTGFDVAGGGTADALAGALDLGENAPFGPLPGRPSVKVTTFVPAAAVDRVAGAMSEAGAGRIGNYRGCSFRSEGIGTFLAGEGSSPSVGRAGTFNREPEIRLEMVAPASAAPAVVAALVANHPYEEPAFDVTERWGDAGSAGRVSREPVPGTVGDMGRRVAGALGVAARMGGDPHRPAGRVAVLPGSGGDFIAAAAAAGAGTLVTGDVSHHQARAALDDGMAIIDPGHAPTERPGMAVLARAVAGVLEGVVDLTGMDPNPWRAV